MLFSTIIAGALFAISANAAAANANPYTQVTRVTVTETQTVTKFPKPTTVTTTQTVTKGKTIYTTLFATVTKVKTKTAKVCPSSASPTMSVYANPKAMKARAVAAEPLYAQEFN